MYLSKLRKSLQLAFMHLLYVFQFLKLLYTSVLANKMHKNVRDIKAEDYTVMILSFQTDRPGQTVQTVIRLLLEEQSDQGLHCLPFRLYRLDSLLYGRAT